MHRWVKRTSPRYSYKRHSKLWSALWRLRLFEGCDLSYKVWFERLKKAVNVLGLWFAVNYGKLYNSLMTYVQWTDEGTVAIMESLSITDGPSIIREKFLILAYRDNEIDKKHPLQLMLNRAQSLSSHVHATVIRGIRMNWCRRSFSKTSSQSQSLLRTLCTKRRMETHFIHCTSWKCYKRNVLSFSRLSRWNAIVEAREEYGPKLKWQIPWSNWLPKRLIDCLIR
jgi:hypothetical protein